MARKWTETVASWCNTERLSTNSACNIPRRAIKFARCPSVCLPSSVIGLNHSAVTLSPSPPNQAETTRQMKSDGSRGSNSIDSRLPQRTIALLRITASYTSLECRMRLACTKSDANYAYISVVRLRIYVFVTDELVKELGSCSSVNYCFKMRKVCSCEGEIFGRNRGLNDSGSRLSRLLFIVSFIHQMAAKKLIMPKLS